MKNKVYPTILLLGIAVCLVVLIIGGGFESSKSVRAQVFGVNYLWQDSTTITTVAIDSAYVVQWEQITVRTDTVVLWYRAGAPDTTSWSSREWMRLASGATLSYGPATPLRRLEFRAGAGTGVIYKEGYKKVAQY